MFLFMLVQELVSFDGALLSTAYYLFFPYAIFASRSFQPDPLMVMLILVFFWMFRQWIRTSAWHYVLLAGLFGGLAIFLEFFSAFFFFGGAFGLVVLRFFFVGLLRNLDVWGV